MINLSAEGSHFESASYRDNGCLWLGALIAQLHLYLSTDNRCLLGNSLTPPRFVKAPNPVDRRGNLQVNVVFTQIRIQLQCLYKWEQSWTALSPAAQHSAFHATLQLHSCPLRGEYVYSSPLSPFCEAEIQLLECVACHTSRLRRWILTERSVGHDTPRRSCSLLAHKLPLSDRWPRRHVWFIDSKGGKQVGLGLDLFQGYDYNGNLEEGRGLRGIMSFQASVHQVDVWASSREAEKHKADLCCTLW